MLKEKSETGNLERGYRGTAKTIEKMHALVKQGKLDPTMRRIATWIRLHAPQDPRGSGPQTAEAIFNWTKRHGLFVRDPFQIERIEHPIASMQSLIAARKKGVNTRGKLFAGDCDQYAIWVATLGGLLGYQYAFETAKLDPMRPDEFSHVWASLLVGGQWLPLDSSTRTAYPGWRPQAAPHQFKRWPEKPLEHTMSGVRRNGRFYHGLADSPNGKQYVPMDYFGWGMPKEFDWRTPEVLDTDPARLDLLVPEEPAVPAEEMYPGAEGLRKHPSPSADYRPSLTQGDENFNTGPRYREAGPQPYYKITKRFYPPDSKFNRREVSRADRAPKRPPYYAVERLKNLPVQEVTPVMDQAIPLPILRSKAMPSLNGTAETYLTRRAAQTVVLRPRRVAGGAGMGVDDIVAQTTDTVKLEAEKASSSIWDTITKTVASVVQTGVENYGARVQAKYADKLASATNKVAQGPVVTAQSFPVKAAPAPTPWYLNPWVLIGGGVTVAGGAYVMTRGRSRIRRRRRRR